MTTQIKTFDPSEVASTLGGRLKVQKDRLAQRPISPHGLSAVQLGIMKEMFAADGEISGSELVGNVFGKHVPYMKTDAIYTECLKLSRDWVVAFPLLEASGCGSPYTSTVPEPWENTFKLSEIGKKMKDVCSGNPPQFPHLLVNGFSGQASTIPPHALKGVIDAIIAVNKNPALSDDDMVTAIGYPDYPSGCLVSDAPETLWHIRSKQKSPIEVQPEILTEKTDTGFNISVARLPLGVKPELLIEWILENEKSIKGLRKVSNESADESKVVISLAQGSDRDALETRILSDFGANRKIVCKMSVINKEGVPNDISTANMVKEYVVSRVEYIAVRDGIDISNAVTVLSSEMQAILSNYAKDRHSEVQTLKGATPKNSSDPMLVILTEKGMIRRMSAGVWRCQDRAGKGIDCISASTYEGGTDLISKIAYGQANHILVMASAKGRLFFRTIGDLTEGSKDQMGEPIDALLDSDKSEGVTAIMSMPKLDPTNRLIIITSRGMLKSVLMSKYESAKKAGRAGITLKDGDYVAAILNAPKECEIAIMTNAGNLARVVTNGLRNSEPATQGVKGVSMGANEVVVSACVVSEGDSAVILTTNRNGNGKATKTNEFKPQGLGGEGSAIMNPGSRCEPAQDCACITEDVDLFAASSEGRILRFSSKDVRVSGKGGLGVELLKLASTSDGLASLAVIYPPEKPRTLKPEETASDTEDTIEEETQTSEHEHEHQHTAQDSARVIPDERVDISKQTIGLHQDAGVEHA